MAKLASKSNNASQNRIKKLENDLKQQKSRIDKLEKRLVIIEKAKSRLELVLDEIFGEVKEQLSYIQNPAMKGDLMKLLLKMKKKLD